MLISSTNRPHLNPPLPDRTLTQFGQIIAGGSAPRPPLGSGPQTPLLNGVWRGAPTGTGAGLGAEPPSAFLRRSRPGVWGGAPAPWVHNSIHFKPVWSAVESSNLTCLNPVRRVGCEGERSEAEDRSAPSDEAARPNPWLY